MITEKEAALLRAVRDCGQNAYGVPIRHRYSELLGKDPYALLFGVSFGELYARMNSLEERGLLTSHEGESTPERGNRPKRYYAVTRLGERALEDAERV